MATGVSKSTGGTRWWRRAYSGGLEWTVVLDGQRSVEGHGRDKVVAEGVFRSVGIDGGSRDSSKGW